ncbi:MAG: putative DNA binding domain-containing protein [Lachnospiraceae bacterium]|jgi:hypothetical protein|nr:putative DNA binding domain-containing protein [Lachnospiraceae bacterium]
MKELNLENEIKKLIDLHAEGDYWDFKEEWHNNNADLIHDIICMANSPANRDCYVIIGINNDFEVCEIDNDKRKNQQKVIDLLRRKPKWAGGHIPEVYVKSISIMDKDIDVIIIKQNDNTPFYLMEDYEGGNKKEPNNKKKIFKGCIYSRKGDTNTPRDSTADLYDAELLWKRRFGLLYNPSQRAKNYLVDLENWESLDGAPNKHGNYDDFFYYLPDPDYTVYYVINAEDDENELPRRANDVNDEAIGYIFYYLFAFCNVSYHTDFSNRDEVVLYYKDIPLFCSPVESIDEGRTRIIPPDFPPLNAYYIKNSLHYLIFRFVFSNWGGSYSKDAEEILLRVIPLYENDSEYETFQSYIKEKGFANKRMFGEKITGEALQRLENTFIGESKSYFERMSAEDTAQVVKNDPKLVVNFADPKNKDFDMITEYLRIGKMLVDWLNEWRYGQE